MKSALLAAAAVGGLLLAAPASAQGASLGQKFFGPAEPAIGAARAKQVAEISGKLDSIRDVGDLLALVAKAN